MTVQTSNLAAEAYDRWSGNGKPTALWLDCDTGHDVGSYIPYYPLKA